MISSWHLVSSNYSSCISQIYISVCNFIASRKSFSSHSYFESTCHYRVSESSYTYKCTERCIKTFLHYFHNIQSEQITKNDFHEIFLSKLMHLFLSLYMIFMFFIHIFLI